MADPRRGRRRPQPKSGGRPPARRPPAVGVDRRIRACTPGPGAWTTLDGERVKVGAVRIDPDHEPLEPGLVAVSKNAVHVGTATAPVRLGEVKAFGKKQMDAADWARGVRLPDSTRFGEEPAS